MVGPEGEGGGGAGGDCLRGGGQKETVGGVEGLLGEGVDEFFEEAWVNRGRDGARDGAREGGRKEGRK